MREDRKPWRQNRRRALEMEATEAELAAEAELAEATAEEREDAERGVAWAEDGRGDPAKRKRASARSDLEAADPFSHRGARVDAAGRPAGPARKTPKWALMLDAPDATPGKRRRARIREPSTSSEDPLGVAAAEMASESELSDADSDVELLDQDDGVIPAHAIDGGRSTSRTAGRTLKTRPRSRRRARVGARRRATTWACSCAR